MRTLAPIRFPPSWDTFLERTKTVTANAILQETLAIGRGIEDLAACLEMPLPGLTERLCRLAFEETVKPLLAANLPPDPDIDRVLADPRQFFKVEDAETAGQLAVEWLQEPTEGAPEAAIWAVVAAIDLGLRDFPEALRSATLARAFEAVPDFDRRLRAKDAEAEAAFLAAERRKAEILADLIEAARSSGVAPRDQN